jgi:hypothetical protein
MHFFLKKKKSNFKIILSFFFIYLFFYEILGGILEIEVSFKFKALFMMCILSIKPATNLMKALVLFFYFFIFFL